MASDKDNPHTCLFHSYIPRLDQGQLTIGVFLDLAKAFDIVNHEILIDKLHHYGIRGTCLSWYRSIGYYLNNRSQLVSCNNFSSSACSYFRRTTGQGSVLGPLLFLVYVNDLCNSSEILEFLLFSDDMNVFISGNDIIAACVMHSVMNNELGKVADWCGANYLNVKKTVDMIFLNSRKKIMLR